MVSKYSEEYREDKGCIGAKGYEVKYLDISENGGKEYLGLW